MARMSSVPKAALVSLGCPMNQVDSEKVLGGLISFGFEIVSEEKADIVIVNTCGFIESAREESIDTILQIARLKETGNLKALIVSGCMAERYCEELKKELPEADAIVPLQDNSLIPELCLQLLDRTISDVHGNARVITGPPNSAYLKIAEGCSNCCAYCAIPIIRGPFRSVPEEQIITEAQELVSLGASELILIAQETTAYGSDSKTSLSQLLHRISGIEGAEWIRLLYTHPEHFTSELVKTITDLPKVLPYIDIPIQHISQRILELMGRNTTSSSIKELLTRLRNEINGVVLRTSLMVGYPGETPEDFEMLMEFVRQTRFERMGAFIYSPEEGTRATLLKNTVPVEEAEDRYDRLMRLQSGISEEFHNLQIGREFDMIIDDSNEDAGVTYGRTFMDAPDIDGNVTVPGNVRNGTVFTRVRITDAGTYDLIGEFI